MRHLLLFLLFCSQTNAAPIIEYLRGVHITLTTSTLKAAPKGTIETQPETGLQTITLTDVKDTTNGTYNATALTAGKVGSGLFAGYSKYSIFNRTLEYAIPVSTGDDCAIYQIRDQKFLRLGRGGKLSGAIRWFESREPRFTNYNNNPYEVSYFYDKGFYTQDIRTGPSSEQLIYHSEYPLTSTGDGTWSEDGRYYCLTQIIQTDIPHVQREIQQCLCFDRTTGKVLPGKPTFNFATSTLNGAGMSKSGKWLWAQQRYYSVEDLSNGITNYKSVYILGGHGDWGYNSNNQDVYIWQESAADRVMVYTPATGDLYPSLSMQEIGYCGVHISGGKGWYLISTYPGFSNPAFRYQCFLVQLGPTNKYNHPVFDKAVTTAMWNSGYLSPQPTMLRLFSMNHIWHGYFSEGAAYYDYHNNVVIVGTNHNDSSNMEVRYTKIANAGGPPLPIDNPTTHHLSIPATQQNFTYEVNSAQGNTARGNYTPFASLRTDSFTYAGKPYTLSSLLANSFSNCGLLLYFPLTSIPKGSAVLHAYLYLSANDPNMEGGNHPTGRERISIKQINNPMHYQQLWTPAYLRPNATTTAEASWDGASWQLWGQDSTGTNTVSLKFGTTKITFPKGSLPWSNIDTGANRGTGIGRYGNLSTVLQRIPTDPRISFSTTSVSKSDDLAPLVNDWLSHSNNYGIYLDPADVLGTDYFGNNSSPTPKFRAYAAPRTILDPNPSLRPTLVLEY